MVEGASDVLEACFEGGDSGAVFVFFSDPLLNIGFADAADFPIFPVGGDVFVPVGFPVGVGAGFDGGLGGGGPLVVDVAEGGAGVFGSM
nr:hypothetical protein [Corynebacterium sp. CNJ-954]